MNTDAGRSLGFRVYGVAGSALAGLFVVCAVTAVLCGRLITSTQRLGEVNLASVVAIDAVSSSVERLGMLLGRAPALLKATDIESDLKQSRALVAKGNASFDQLARLATQPNAQAELNAIREQTALLHKEAERVFALALQFQQQEAVALLLETVYPLQKKVLEALDELKEKTVAQTETEPLRIVAEAKSGRVAVVVFGSALTLVLGVVSMMVVRRSIVQPMRRLVVRLTNNSEQTTGAARSVATTSEALASDSKEQAASVEETSSTLEEISSVTKRNAENADTARAVASRARAAAEGGATDMEEMSRAVAEIKAASDNIGRILKTIDEIAFQTNILALNAAVEAARAGEAGMGFAVVAEEVRNLAQRSAQAAKETAEKIEHSLRASDNGVLICEKVVGRLRQIVGSAREVDQIVGEIAVASQEQRTGIDQVGKAIHRIEKVTQSNAANAEDTSAAAAELNSQATALRASVIELSQLIEGARSATSRPPDSASRSTAESAENSGPEDSPLDSDEPAASDETKTTPRRPVIERKAHLPDRNGSTSLASRSGTPTPSAASFE